MPHLITTHGALGEETLGAILPHEHVFANFYADEDCGADKERAAAAMLPALQAAKAAGVTAIVDATAIGGARRVDVICKLARAADLPIVIATGIFKQPTKFEWVSQHGEDGLAAWMIGELRHQIDGTGGRAGWIKLSAADDGLLNEEIVLLRAAAVAGRAANAAIGSHTVRGRVALDQIDVIERAGYTASRFIWIHAQMEPDFALHLEGARRGAYIEYDNIGTHPADELYIEWIMRMLDAGYGDRLLISHDRVGYDPRLPDGGTIAPYTTIHDVFLPTLRAAGIDEAAITQITHANPFRAYAR